MKKKMTALCLCMAMLAIAVVGGTLAYFTDTDNKTNTFTVGDVDITLVEKNEDGTEFEQDQVLLPGEENKVVKDVTVENTGTNDAYMWVEIWLPAILDNENAALNNLHFNPFDTYKFPDGTVKPMRGSEAKKLGGVLVAETVAESIGTKTINNQTYNGYRIHIKDDTPKASGESTASLLYQVYMDARVTQGENGYVLIDGTEYTGEWDIVVDAFGIQADGFETIDEAMTAYYAAQS